MGLEWECCWCGQNVFPLKWTNYILCLLSASRPTPLGLQRDARYTIEQSWGKKKTVKKKKQTLLFFLIYPFRQKTRSDDCRKIVERFYIFTPDIWSMKSVLDIKSFYWKKKKNFANWTSEMLKWIFRILRTDLRSVGSLSEGKQYSGIVFGHDRSPAFIFISVFVGLLDQFILFPWSPAAVTLNFEISLVRDCDRNHSSIYLNSNLYPTGISRIQCSIRKKKKNSKRNNCMLKQIKRFWTNSVWFSTDSELFRMILNDCQKILNDLE